MHQVVTDPIAHLDFEFVRACDVKTWAGEGWVGCPERALWWSRHHCCGRVAFACAPHRADGDEYECADCGADIYSVHDCEWGRL